MRRKMCNERRILDFGPRIGGLNPYFKLGSNAINWELKSIESWYQ